MHEYLSNQKSLKELPKVQSPENNKAIYSKVESKISARNTINKIYVVSRIISERWGFNKWKRLYQSHLTIEKFINKFNLEFKEIFLFI